jgi:hypothetical protein
MLAQHFACRGPSHIHSHVAAADDDNLLADGEPVTEIHIEQKIDALVDSVQIHAGNGEVAAAVRADCDQNGIEVSPQIGDGEIAAGRMVQFQSDVAGGENLAHLRFHHVAGQTIFGQAEIEHAAGHLRRFKDGDGVAHQGKVVRRERPTGPAPTMAMRNGSFSCVRPAFTSTGCRDSGPYRSVRKRLSARIAIGLSISPRRHAVSQG